MTIKTKITVFNKSNSIFVSLNIFRGNKHVIWNIIHNTNRDIIARAVYDRLVLTLLYS